MSIFSTMNKMLHSDNKPDPVGGSATNLPNNIQFKIDQFEGVTKVVIQGNAGVTFLTKDGRGSSIKIISTGVKTVTEGEGRNKGEVAVVAGRGASIYIMASPQAVVLLNGNNVAPQA